MPLIGARTWEQISGSEENKGKPPGHLVHVSPPLGLTQNLEIPEVLNSPCPMSHNECPSYLSDSPYNPCHQPLDSQRPEARPGPLHSKVEVSEGRSGCAWHL